MLRSSRVYFLLSLLLTTIPSIHGFFSPGTSVTRAPTKAPSPSPTPAPSPSAVNGIRLSQIGTTSVSGSEIVDFDPLRKQAFVTDGGNNRLVVLNMTDPTKPSQEGLLDLNAFVSGGSVTSVAVHAPTRLLAVAVQASVRQNPGSIVIFKLTTTGLPTYFTRVFVGSLPDMVTFTPDGKYILCANEGEPNNDYTIDPEGSITIIPTSEGATQFVPKTADFTRFTTANLPANVRIFGPGASVPQDLEPEYIAISQDSLKAWVSLQENNAIAVIDIVNANVTDIFALGFKDHSMAGNELDASDRDTRINIVNWPVFGMYQPDSLAVYTVASVPYVVTANEGDAREYTGTPGLEEEARVKDIVLDPTAFPNAAAIQLDDQLGRLTITKTLGDTGSDNDYDQLYSFGARSFSIWNGNTGALVWDSGREFANITAAVLPTFFNGQGNDAANFDTRSDNKGCEPEGVVLGEIRGRTFAFIGLERIGGVMVYDVTVPTAPTFVQYVTPATADISPEGLKFVSASESPIANTPLLLVAHETSNTVTVFRIDVVA